MLPTEKKHKGTDLHRYLTNEHFSLVNSPSRECMQVILKGKKTIKSVNALKSVMAVNQQSALAGGPLYGCTDKPIAGRCVVRAGNPHLPVRKVGSARSHTGLTGQISTVQEQ